MTFSCGDEVIDDVKGHVRRTSNSPFLRRRLALVGLALAAVLRPSSAHAFRTAADQPDFAGTPRVRWAQNLVNYEINDERPPGLTAVEIETVAARALSTWSTPWCSALSFGFSATTSGAAMPGDGVNT